MIHIKRDGQWLYKKVATETKIITELEEILDALKVKTTKEALQKIDMFTEWNKHDVKVIEQLKKEIKQLKDGQGKHI